MKIDLTEDELLMLDGRCAPATQALVDDLKDRRAYRQRFDGLTTREADFVHAIIAEARAAGRLVHRGASLRYCEVCGTRAGYATYKRTSRNHRKGEIDYDKPLSLYGIEMKDTFIRMEGYPSLGCCNDCWRKLKDVIADELYLGKVRAEIPQDIMGHPPKYKRWRNVQCTVCGWTGHEGQMRELNAIMGGKYRGGCPKCVAENRFLGPTHVKDIEGFTVVDVVVAQPVPKELPVLRVPGARDKDGELYE